MQLPSPRALRAAAWALVVGCAAVPAAAVDLLPYILTSCSGRSAANDFGSQRKFTIPMGMSGSQGRFVYMKGSDNTGFEEWYVDANWFYIRLDNTWAWQNSCTGAWCDTQCGSINGGCNTCKQRWAGHTGDWAYTRYYDPATGGPAPWIKRNLNLEFWGAQETFSTWIGIQGYRTSTCQYCGTNFDSGGVWRTTRATRLQTWASFSDVIRLEITGGPGAGENYYFARGRGWVGFNNAVASTTQVNDGRSPSLPCAGYAEGNICAATGGSTGGILPNGRYSMEVAAYPGGYADVKWGATANGTPIWLWSWNGSGAQLWDLEHLGNNVYRFRGVGSGRCLATQRPIPTNGVSSAFLWDCNGDVTEHFRIDDAGGGYYYLRLQSMNFNSCLDTCCSIGQSSNTYVYPCHLGPNQKWKLVRR